MRERVARPLGLSGDRGGRRHLPAGQRQHGERDPQGDPRSAASIRAALTLVVFGGNGPVHAGMQAAELGIRRILVPKLSPAFSALGLLLTDHVVDEMRSYIAPVGRVDLDARQSRSSPRWRQAARAALATGRRPQARRTLRALRGTSATRADLRHAGADRRRAPGHVTARTLARHGRALPSPARGAAHLRLPRRGADPARPAA